MFWLYAVSFLVLLVLPSAATAAVVTPAPDRAIQERVFHLKNRTCLGTGAWTVFHSDAVAPALDGVGGFSIDYVSRSILPLSAAGERNRIDVDYERCGRPDSGFCVVVTLNQRRYIFHDPVGSRGRERPWTQVHRRVVVVVGAPNGDRERLLTSLGDDPIAAVDVWLSGERLRRLHNAKPSVVAALPMTPLSNLEGAIVVQGTGCLDEIVLSAHWRSVIAKSHPIDLRIHPLSTFVWDWYDDEVPRAGNSPRIKVLSPLRNQIFNGGTDVSVRAAVTASLDTLYNSHLTMCMTVQSLTGSTLGGDCFPAHVPSESFHLAADEFPMIPEMAHNTSFVVRIDVVAAETGTSLARQDIPIVITRGQHDQVPAASTLPALVMPGWTSIGMGPGVPPLRLENLDDPTLANMSSLRATLHAHVRAHVSSGAVESDFSECDFLFSDGREDFPRPSRIDAAASALGADVGLLLMRAKVNEITVSPACRLPGDESAGLFPARRDALASREVAMRAHRNRGMPCMQSGSATAQRGSICYPLVPGNDPKADAPSKRWEWASAGLLDPVARHHLSASLRPTPPSAVACQRTWMSLDPTTSCRCQRCAVEALLFGDAARVVYFGDVMNMHSQQLPPNGLPLQTSRHARIFSTNVEGEHQRSASNHAGSVALLGRKPTMGVQCRRVGLTEKSIHFAAVGTFFNIYHILLDLVQPMWQAQDDAYGPTAAAARRRDTILVLSVGNVANTKDDVDVLIRLAQWYDLPASALLTLVAGGGVVSRGAFDAVVAAQGMPLCVDDLFVGHKPTGVLQADFATHSGSRTQSSVATLARNREFRLFLLQGLLGDIVMRDTSGLKPRGLAFIIRDHNRRWENLAELAAVARNRNFSVVSLEPQFLSLRRLADSMSNLRDEHGINIVAAVTGAGVSNLLFLPPGITVILAYGEGTTGWSRRSFGRLLRGIGVHVVVLAANVATDLVSSAGWLGAEDEDRRVGKDMDIRVPPSVFSRALAAAGELPDVHTNGSGQIVDIVYRTAVLL